MRTFFWHVREGASRSEGMGGSPFLPSLCSPLCALSICPSLPWSLTFLFMFPSFFFLFPPPPHSVSLLLIVPFPCHFPLLFLLFLPLSCSVSSLLFPSSHFLSPHTPYPFPPPFLLSLCPSFVLDVERKSIIPRLSLYFLSPGKRSTVGRQRANFLYLR